MSRTGQITRIWLIILCSSAISFSATLQERLVTRIDTVTVKLRGKHLSILATGMGRTPSAMGRGGRLLRRGADHVLNKDGLLEYDLVFNAVPNYSGFTMKPIKASFTERSVPEGIKGVRVFAEYNQYDALIEPPKKRKSLLPFGRKRPDEMSQQTSESITGSSPHP